MIRYIFGASFEQFSLSFPDVNKNKGVAVTARAKRNILLISSHYFYLFLGFFQATWGTNFFPTHPLPLKNDTWLASDVLFTNLMHVFCSHSRIALWMAAIAFGSIAVHTERRTCQATVTRTRFTFQGCHGYQYSNFKLTTLLWLNIFLYSIFYTGDNFLSPTLDSEDDYHSGSRNVSHQQQSF